MRCGNRAEPLAGISEAQEQAHGCYMLSPCPRARSGPHPGLLFTRVWLACSRAWGTWRQAHRASSLSTTLPAPSSRAHAHQPWGSPCTEQNQRKSDPRTAAAGSPTMSHKTSHPKKGCRVTRPRSGGMPDILGSPGCPRVSAKGTGQQRSQRRSTFECGGMTCNYVPTVLPRKVTTVVHTEANILGPAAVRQQVTSVVTASAE